MERGFINLIPSFWVGENPGNEVEVSLILNGHIGGFHSQTHKLEHLLSDFPNGLKENCHE